MDDQSSDPEVINKLKNQPPYDEPEEEVVEEPQEEEEVVEEETEEVTDEEALANSKNPERTAKRMEQLREQAKQQNVLDASTPQPDSPQLNFDPTSYFRDLSPQQQQQVQNVGNQQAQDIYAEMVNQDGYLDQNKFFQALKQSDAQVKQAQEEARQAREESKRTNQQFQSFYKNSVMREVHQKYPSLDPNTEDFDDKYFEKVRNELIFQQTQGFPPDPMAAAEKWYDDTVNKKEKEQKAQADNTRANINATTGTSPQRQTVAQRDSLVAQTRAGGKSGREALSERLKAINQ